MTRDEAMRRRQQVIMELLRSSPGKTWAVKELQARLDAQGLANSPPTVRKDIESLVRERAPLEYKHGEVILKPHAITEFERRLAEQTDEKSEIASVAKALTLGNKDVQNRLVDLVGNKMGWHDIALKHLLVTFFQKSDRSLCSDAGSTTLHIIRELAKEPLTDECRHLTIVTNSPRAAEEIYKTEIRAVLIGGELRRERYSLVGHLAERSLEALDIVTDLSFIGATGVDVDRGFTSDEPMEAVMKMRMLDRSRIRCAVVDYKKIAWPGATFSVFVNFSPKRLDFLICDEKVAVEKSEPIRQFREMLQANGICLLTPSVLGLESSKGKASRTKVEPKASL